MDVDNKKKRCAYCGGNGPFTKEHIVPNFLYNKHPKQKFGYNQKAGQFITWEATIRDVCKACNNGPLSSLDAYGKKFYEGNRCERQFLAQENVLIHYDYKLLLRWLLKISFNAIRSAGGSSELINGVVPFILKGENEPSYSYMLVEIVKNAKIYDNDRQYLPEEAKEWDTIPAQMFRAGQITPFNNSHSVGRFIAINSFYFYILLCSQNCPFLMRERILECVRDSVGSIGPLRRSKRELLVSVSDRNCLDAYIHQAAVLGDPWKEYWNRIKR
jgi:hypothetical protein